MASTSNPSPALTLHTIIERIPKSPFKRVCLCLHVAVLILMLFNLIYHTILEIRWAWNRRRQRKLALRDMEYWLADLQTKALAASNDGCEDTFDCAFVTLQLWLQAAYVAHKHNKNISSSLLQQAAKVGFEVKLPGFEPDMKSVVVDEEKALLRDEKGQTDRETTRLQATWAAKGPFYCAQLQAFLELKQKLLLRNIRRSGDIEDEEEVQEELTYLVKEYCSLSAHIHNFDYYDWPQVVADFEGRRTYTAHCTEQKRLWRAVTEAMPQSMLPRFRKAVKEKLETWEWVEE